MQTKKDRLDLIENLRSGFIEFLATDHAPHTLEEKYNAFKNTGGLSNVEYAESLKLEDLSRYKEICRKDGVSGAPWLDNYGDVCLILMHSYNFTPKDIARISSYNPGLFVNQQLKHQAKGIDYGKGFGMIDVGYVGSLTVLNLKKANRVRSIETKCKWSPMDNMHIQGQVDSVFVFGKKVV